MLELSTLLLKIIGILGLELYFYLNFTTMIQVSGSIGMYVAFYFSALLSYLKR